MPDNPIDDTVRAAPDPTPQRIDQQPINGQKSGLSPRSRGNCAKKIALWIVAVMAAIVVGAAAASWLWYNAQLAPVETDKEKRILVVVKEGSSPSQIGELLKDQSVIRSKFAFDIHTRLSGTRGKLQAGAYRLAPSDSTPNIVKQLTSGKVDMFAITFLPGATLDEHRKVLLDADYSETEIDAAFSKRYDTQDSPIFADKPSTADLEGYIYGETYQFGANASVESILRFTFVEFEKVIENNNIVDGLKAQRLNLYEGITLASIIQREVASSSAKQPSVDQKQVAQVFYTRLSAGMPLGSDVTFIYAASKLGVEPISTLNSPYNTRINTGLPPGPIASPGLTALLATISPASTDYVYFVAGDDGKTYFGRTLQEHEQNVANYCTTECNKP